MLKSLRPAALLLILASVALTACNFNPTPPTPTVQGFESPTPTSATEEPSRTPSLTPSAPPTVAAIRLASATPSITPPPSTETETATPTEGYYVYRVAQNDTFSGILPRYGYNDFRVVPAILTLNPIIQNENNLPVGQEILIPRMTFTPTPPNYEATVSIMQTLGQVVPGQRLANEQVGQHTVVEGESVNQIAYTYKTTIEIIRDLNPELVFQNCDMSNRSGGPDCNVPIRIGQVINVPLPTPTPTLSPTPSGSETATPTPTYNPPFVVEPPNGGIVSGPVVVQWLSVGILKRDEYYYVEVINRTLGTADTYVTKETMLRLPDSLIPPEGEQHDIELRVVVVRGAGEDYTVIGGVMPSRTFKWQRR